MSDFNLDVDGIFGEKKQNNTSKESDIPLRWISNGNDCTKRGTVYIDTEINVTAKSIVSIKFNAAKWDGPIARTITDNPCWKLSMSNNKLVFNFPIRQPKQIDVGTFLPNQDYLVQTCGPIAMIFKEEPSLFDDLKFFRTSIKAARLGYQFGDEDMVLNSTINLFGNNREYAWQGLKIMRIKVNEGKTLVVDMKPVLHNGTPCFYDSVRNRYFYFSGKGDVFIEKY